MKIGVAGLWHLGVMYAVGFAELGHEVVAYDPDPLSVIGFKVGELRVYEPGLKEMLIKNTESENLVFTNRELDLQDVELFVLAYDTPVDENDKADVNYVLAEFERIVRYLSPTVTTLISSQLPVGSCDIIKEILKKSGHKGNAIVQPENLRLGRALSSFFDPTRIVVGTWDGQPDPIVDEAFNNINAPIVWMYSKSAEMTKHALNAYLATSITFMGEISEICEIVGADAKEVEIGLKSDPRIGSKAYLSPGLGFAGGTLARDVNKLKSLQMQIRKESAIFSTLLTSNSYNNAWISRSLEKITTGKEKLRICFWGVSYTQNTDTLRRSEIYKVMEKLANENAIVSYVVEIQIRGNTNSNILCKEFIEESLENIDVLVVSERLAKALGNKKVFDLLQSDYLWVLDPSRVLLELDPNLVEKPRYLTVGKGK